MTNIACGLHVGNIVDWSKISIHSLYCQSARVGFPDLTPLSVHRGNSSDDNRGF